MKLFLQYFLSSVLVGSITSQAAEGQCEFAQLEAQKFLNKAKTEFGVLSSVQKIQQIQRFCPVNWEELKTSPAELKQLEQRGRADVYRHGLELLNAGTPLSPDGLKKVGLELGLSAEKIDQDLKQNMGSTGLSAVTEKDSASSCRPMDLRSQLPAVRDQGNLSWCFAYSLADLLSFKFKQEVSARDLAYKYNSEKARFFSSSDYNSGPGVSQQTQLMLEGGSLEGVLESLWSTRTYCLEKDLPSTDYRHNAEFHTYLSSIKQVIELSGRVNSQASNNICDQDQAALKVAFPGLASVPIKSVLEALKTKESAVMLEKIGEIILPE